MQAVQPASISRRQLVQLARILRFKDFQRFFPVHQVPKGRDVIRSPVLIIQVVGMFPNVQADDRGTQVISHAFHDGGI